MNVTCPDCSSIFRVDPAKVPGSGIQARCNVCGAVLLVAHAAVAAPEFHEPPAGLPEVTAVLDAPAPTLALGNAADPDQRDKVSAPVGLARAVEFAAQSVSPVSPALTAARDAQQTPNESAPSEPVSATDTVPGPPAAAQPRAARPVNPYLNNTPELRARRLARALVSDLVAYNPQKREQGLRDGTLRQLFRDEIRKSWDEYVEQVGPGVAESTPHFQDALNDVLAGGRRVF